MPLLSPHCRVITFDDRGHGRSTNPTGELSYRLIGDDTAALIEALGLDHPFVGGWSDGGQVALEFGLHYPQLARGLIVGGAYTDFQSEAAQAELRRSFRPDNRGNIDSESLERDNPGWASFLRACHPQSPDQWERVRQQTFIMWRDYEGLTHARVERISTPAIVIQADHDQLVPLDEAVKLYHWLPDAELAVLPGSDHVRPFLEPELFVAVLIDFIRRHGG